MNLQIRKMTLFDLETISENLEKDFDDFWNASVFKQVLINESSYYLVALLDDEIVGFAGYMLILDEADITNIVVRKDMRNKGIATKLLSSLLDSIDEIDKIETVTLEVNENNKYAIQLYKNFDFKKVGLRKNYYRNHEDALIFTKFKNPENNITSLKKN